MVRAIIFDCFGVLASDGWLPFRERHFGGNTELLTEATDFNKQSDAGLIGYDQFIAHMADMTGLTPREVRHQIENNVPDAKLFAYIREQLKPAYKIGFLSNASDNWLNDMFEPDQVALFDAVSLSYETGFIKPHPRAYEIIASKLEVPVEECVFIDDQPRYAEGAKDVGMHAIVYKGFESFATEIERIINQSGK